MPSCDCRKMRESWTDPGHLITAFVMMHCASQIIYMIIYIIHIYPFLMIRIKFLQENWPMLLSWCGLLKLLGFKKMSVTKCSSYSILKSSILRRRLIIRPLTSHHTIWSQSTSFVLNYLLFKTTRNIIPHFLCPMGGLNIEGTLHIFFCSIWKKVPLPPLCFFILYYCTSAS